MVAARLPTMLPTQIGARINGLVAGGSGTPPVDSFYRRPGGVDRYRRPDGTSLYKRP
jgi:hypothetical protein